MVATTSTSATTANEIAQKRVRVVYYFEICFCLVPLVLVSPLFIGMIFFCKGAVILFIIPRTFRTGI